MKTYRLPPLYNTAKTPEEITGMMADKLKSHFEQAQDLEGLDKYEFGKKMKSFGQDNRNACAAVYDKLAAHGFYVHDVVNGEIVYGMATRNPEEAPMYPEIKRDNEQKTPLTAGKYRFRIVMMVYNKEMSVEDGLAYQSMSNEAITKLFELGELR